MLRVLLTLLVVTSAGCRQLAPYGSARDAGAQDGPADLTIHQEAGGGDGVLFPDVATQSDGITASDGSVGLDGTTPDAFAPTPTAVSLGGMGDDEGRALASDGKGGVWMVGSVTCNAVTVDLGDGVQRPCGGGIDMVVAHVNAAGQLSFLALFGGSGSERADSAAPDGNGGIWITGRFDGPMNVAAGTVGTQGGGDLFVLRVDAQGKASSVFVAGGSSDEVTEDGSAICAKQASGFWVVASLQLDTLDGRFPAVPALGALDIFAFEWPFSPSSAIERWTGVGVDRPRACATTDTTGSGLLVAGRATNQLLVATGSPALQLTAPSPLLVKREPSGQLSTLVFEANSEGELTAVGQGPGGTVWVGGTFSGSLKVGNKPLSSGGGVNGLVSWVDASMQPAQSFGISSGGGGTWVQGLSVDPLDRYDVYVVGSLDTSASLKLTWVPSGSSSTSLPKQGRDFFILRERALDPLNTVIKSYGGPGDDQARAVLDAGPGYLWVTGSFSQSMTLPGTVPVGSRGGRDVFIARLPKP